MKTFGYYLKEIRKPLAVYAGTVLIFALVGYLYEVTRDAVGYALLLSAVILLVCGTLTFSGLMVTSQAFRAQVLEVLVQVYEEITNFRFSAEGETDRTAGDFVLTYLPQGMEETVRQSSRIRHYICFEDNAGNMLEVTHIVVGANASSILGVDTEDAEVEYFKIHNSEAMAISKNLDHTIFWTEDNCYYLLSGTIPMEELKQVALGLEPIS